MVGRGHPQSTPSPSSELMMSSEKSGAGRRRRGPEPLWGRELLDPYEAHGGPAKRQVLIRPVWGGAQDSAFPTNSQMILLLSVYRPHFKEQQGLDQPGPLEI